MEQLFKDFNCDEGTIGNNIVHCFHADKTNIDKLENYDINILTEINKKVSQFKDGLFNKLLRRRNNSSYDKDDIENMRCGYNVANDCEKKINNMINEKYEEQYQQKLEKIYKEQKYEVISILKYVAAMVGLFIILIIFDYACK